MRRTIGAMLSLTFGNEPEVRRAAAQINALHARAHGRLPDTVGLFRAGTHYSAADPTLLTWVHATLVDSQLRTYRLFAGTLTTDEEEGQYCAEAAAVGPLLVRADGLPQTAAAVAGCLDDIHQSGRLVVTDTARDLAVALLSPPGGRLAGDGLRSHNNRRITARGAAERLRPAVERSPRAGTSLCGPRAAGCPSSGAATVLGVARRQTGAGPSTSRRMMTEEGAVARPPPGRLCQRTKGPANASRTEEALVVTRLTLRVCPNSQRDHACRAFPRCLR